MFRIFARRWKTSTTEEATSPNQSITPTEFAWRTHSAITDWTARVDVKASIVLALETVIWQIFWQPALPWAWGKVFVLVGVTGFEPVASAV
jgi:hypothetical protein